MNREKVKNYLNICRKAGYLIVGSDRLKSYNKKLYLILFDKNKSATIEKILDKFKDIEVQEIENLGEIVSIDNCKIVGIKNLGLSEEIKKGIKGE